MKFFLPFIILVVLLVVGFFAFNQNKIDRPRESLILNNNDTLEFKSEKISFDYPKTWSIKQESQNTKWILLDPIGIKPEYPGMDGSRSMIGIGEMLHDENSYVVGYASFPTVYIGKNNSIAAKKFERYFSKDSPEVTAQGSHEIIYYVGERYVIDYSGNYDDTHLQEFNQIVGSLVINN